MHSRLGWRLQIKKKKNKKGNTNFGSNRMGMRTRGIIIWEFYILILFSAKFKKKWTYRRARWDRHGGHWLVDTAAGSEMKQQPRLGAARRKQNKQKKNKKKRKENDSTDEWSDGGWIDVSGVETCVEGRRVRSAAARWRYRRKLAEKKAKKKIKKKREIKNPMKDPVRGLGGGGKQSIAGGNRIEICGHRFR